MLCEAHACSTAVEIGSNFTFLCGQAALISEAELDHLVLDIPDMRTRLGIRSA